MDARLLRVALVAASFLSLGAGYRTQNFIVSGPSPQLAQEVAGAAEDYRRRLAVDWLGKELPPWRDPCPVQISVGPHLGAGGATSFMFENGRPFGWSMSIQGSHERLLDSVLPHEITHMLFATHFGQPLPRWADEGACTTVEHVSEKAKQQGLLIEFLKTGRGIPFNELFAMQEYPADMLPLYSQGYSLARFLIAQGGRLKFVAYVGDGMKRRNWTKATQEHYGYKSLSELQLTWNDWVRRGTPPLPAQETLVALQADSSEGPLAPLHLAAAERHEGRAESSTDGEPTYTAVTFAQPTENSEHGGWYARVRDRTYADRREATGEEDQQRPAPRRSAEGSGLRQAAPPVSQAVSRPQPVTRPQQVILEWSQPHPQQAPAGPVATPGIRPPSSPAPAPRGTIWR